MNITFINVLYRCYYKNSTVNHVSCCSQRSVQLPRPCRSNCCILTTYIGLVIKRIDFQLQAICTIPATFSHNAVPVWTVYKNQSLLSTLVSRWFHFRQTPAKWRTISNPYPLSTAYHSVNDVCVDAFRLFTGKNDCVSLRFVTLHVRWKLIST